QDRYRSVPLERFAPLARVPGVTLVSLQKGDGSEQLGQVRFPVLALEGLDEGSGPFVDTAAVMAGLDLVVTTDTAVPHLAGALGVHCWVALPAVPDWRWLLGRDDSPWYPSLRLFRQERPGDWDPVFRRLAEALGQPLDAGGRARTPPAGTSRPAPAGAPAAGVSAAAAQDILAEARRRHQAGDLPAA